MTESRQIEWILDSEEKISRLFTRWGEMGTFNSSPLYKHLALHIAQDSDLLRLAAHSQRSQPPPNMIFAAVQYLLAQDQAEPLHAFYDQFCLEPRPVAEAFPVFRAYCMDNADRLIPVIETRRTQTNAIGRSQFLTLAFQKAASSQPLTLIEVGCSAGLNLNWNRFGYDFGDWGRLGEAESPVQLATIWQGAQRPIYRAELPTVANAVGIDLNPLDVTKIDDACWLEALIWPEHHARRNQLRQAIAVAKQHPPALQRGDMFELLPTAVCAASAETQLVIFGSFVLYQLSHALREQFDRLLDELAREREICWISAEWIQTETPTLTLTRWQDDQRQTKRLANIEPHGRWIAWQ
jgi:hypothetical protein